MESVPLRFESVAAVGLKTQSVKFACAAIVRVAPVASVICAASRGACAQTACVPQRLGSAVRRSDPRDRLHARLAARGAVVANASGSGTAGRNARGARHVVIDRFAGATALTGFRAFT
ncbi:hypothetical protein ACFJIW_15785 [Tahibacter sp. UC22_41]|uniref:hypothetical protein n=1 Tax=Tahibacter sp. UC22_41 TaxID=3350178 RepID=UPI0036DAF678